MYDAATNDPYDAISLDGYATNEDGYFVLATMGTGIPAGFTAESYHEYFADMGPGSPRLIETGAAVALYYDQPVSDFDLPWTVDYTTGLIDALVFTADGVSGSPSVLLTEGIEPIPIAEGPYTDKPNPHAWMSPRNALVYVENIRKAFVELDPDNAEIYNANAKAYSEKIQAIDDQLAADLAQVSDSQRFLVSCEGAFSYLARDYDMQEIYMWPINAEQQFTPKQVQSLIDAVKTNDVPTIFCESTVSDDGQKQVARATGARFGGNLYVDSLSTEGSVTS